MTWIRSLSAPHLPESQIIKRWRLTTKESMQIEDAGATSFPFGTKLLSPLFVGHFQIEHGGPTRRSAATRDDWLARAVAQRSIAWHECMLCVAFVSRGKTVPREPDDSPASTFGRDKDQGRIEQLRRSYHNDSVILVSGPPMPLHTCEGQG